MTVYVTYDNGQTYQPMDVEMIPTGFTEGTGPFAICECGAAKCGSEIHSDWCPKHV